ncbi:hypothetical protein L2E82_25512 [Cichorium intybus]|uniref:Uncharacterized protein n=1 Tax=Cichorium intybus TaxID=13427 RepID=A0ACB9E3A0_CICIN|nr:hypothetical protein L2E82_25512 [Cichorium intybus]
MYNGFNACYCLYILTRQIQVILSKKHAKAKCLCKVLLRFVIMKTRMGSKESVAELEKNSSGGGNHLVNGNG